MNGGTDESDIIELEKRIALLEHDRRLLLDNQDKDQKDSEFLHAQIEELEQQVDELTEENANLVQALERAYENKTEEA